MRRGFIRIASIAAVLATAFPAATISHVQAAGSAPDYADTSLLPVCISGANGFTNKPCYQPDPAPATDQGQAYLGECSQSITNFCYSLKIDGNNAPADLKATVTVGAYKTHDSSVGIAGYEAYVNLWRVPSGNTFLEDYFGWGKRPSDQKQSGTTAGNFGKLDLTGATGLTANSEITMTIKYKTLGLPQYSVLVANEGTMGFDITGQDLTLTLKGKPSRTALEAANKTINFDSEKNDDLTLPWTDRCGFPNMKIVVCNVERATEEPLVFFARSKTFVNAPASETPGPIWVNTNAAYFHFPSVEIDSTTKTRSIQFRTAAPHFLSDGVTVNKGNAAAFIPNGVLTQWKIEKTDEALKKALAASIVKGDAATQVSATFTISDLGVKVFFPEITYSAPMIKVGEAPATAATTTVPSATTAAPVTQITTSPTPSITTKTLGKGKTKTLTSLIKPVGKGKATWKTSGGCTIAGKSLRAPKKAANCKLTLSQAKSGKTPARKVTINVKVK